jgi:DHA2 family multidrug resistance protein
MMGTLPFAAPAPAGRIAPKWKVLISVTFGIFMVILDTTVVNVAFQTLRAEYGATLNDSQWIISIYVLALGISTPWPVSSRSASPEADHGGPRHFVFGSLLCGLAPSLPFLITARALQGFGGGISTPLSIAFLLRTFPPSEQGLALGIFGIAILVAPAIGPMLGGILVDAGMWRAIFFINPPIGLVGIILGSRFLPNFKSGHKPRLDVWGLITEIIGFGAVLYAASIAANVGWTSPEVLKWFAVGAIGLTAFAVVELFIAKEPLDLHLFAKRVFTNATVLGYVSVIALFGAEFLMPIYLQAVRGISATATGLILLPLAITGAIATVIAGRMYDKIGPRLIMGFGFGVLVINTCSCRN